MYLKSLTLKGFKSFADRAHMVFEPGLTVIVGPNGSGKSNVSDAIRWVLGEQSAKQLRGAAMEDVVFAGSSARKPVGMAEVDLTLDNSDHVLPVDFEEVVVTRRMYRSGESEYLINGAPARLLDITDILHDTGLGKETHSIIGQGKLDSILASKPEERRALIEEAAGISKHKRRRERSLKRLESMESHLQRVLDVQKEVSRQLKPLERQVDKAKRASEISERARELRCILAVDDLRRLRARWDEVQRAERERSSERDVTNAVVAQRTQELDNLRLLLEEKGIFAGDLSEQRRRAQLVCEKLEGSLRLLDEKGRSMAQRTSQLLPHRRTGRRRRRGHGGAQDASRTFQRDEAGGGCRAQGATQGRGGTRPRPFKLPCHTARSRHVRRVACQSAGRREERRGTRRNLCHARRSAR